MHYEVSNNKAASLSKNHNCSNVFANVDFTIKNPKGIFLGGIHLYIHIYMYMYILYLSGVVAVIITTLDDCNLG